LAATTSGSRVQGARLTLAEARRLASGYQRASLRAELDAAATLLTATGIQTRVVLPDGGLGAAGIDARVDLDLPGVPPAVEAVLAWAVREGVTNVLRHSQASACQITAGRRDGQVWLEVGNDGARAPARAGDGSGLAGLTDRAFSLAGSVIAGPTRDGRFRLLVEVPEVAEEER
jgi:two-component system, NarL family, sensor histidine kinase DesK